MYAECLDCFGRLYCSWGKKAFRAWNKKIFAEPTGLYDKEFTLHKSMNEEDLLYLLYASFFSAYLFLRVKMSMSRGCLSYIVCQRVRVVNGYYFL